MERFESTIAACLGELSPSLDAISGIYGLQGRLCDRLEEIADALPEFDPALIGRVMPFLRDALPCLMCYEETVWLPAISNRADPNCNLARLSEQVRTEHEADRDSALDINDTLGALVDGKQMQDANCNGYMLRAFFEALSRHVAWECHSLLPIARSVLGQSDQQRLAAALPARIHTWQRSL